MIDDISIKLVEEFEELAFNKGIVKKLLFPFINILFLFIHPLFIKLTSS